jgi:stage IV sporulation protein FB
MRLFTILGVPVSLSPWLILIMAVMLVTGQGNMLCIAVIAIGLHEIGHALCARALGMPVSEVYFFPLGGTSRLAMPLEEAGWREAVMALFGPAINLALALIAIEVQQHVLHSDALAPFIMANLTVCAFNLLPALPMDGGRALRAMLVAVVGPDRATRFCVLLSKCIAIGIVGLFLYSLFSGAAQWFALPIGIFLFISAHQEKMNMRGYFSSLSGKTAVLSRDRAARMRMVAVRKGARAGDVLKSLSGSRINRIVVMDDEMNTLYEMDESELVRRALDKGLDQRL